MKEKLISLLSDIRPEIDFEEETNYIDQGLLDSLDVVTVMEGICEEFDIELGPDEMKKENFNTLEGMLQMIKNA